MEERILKFDWYFKNLKPKSEDDTIYSISSPIFPNELIDNEKSQHLWFLKLTMERRKMLVYSALTGALVDSPRPKEVAGDVDLSLCLAWAKNKYYFCAECEIYFSYLHKWGRLKILNEKHLFHITFNPVWTVKGFISSAVLDSMLESCGPFHILCRMKIQIEKCTIHTNPKEIPEFEKMFNNEEYSDFTVVTLEKEFKVHKTILAIRSKVFAAMFQNEMKEKEQGFVRITDFDDKVVEEFLRYLYCGKVEGLDKLSKDLLNIADKYSVQGLKNMCLEEICNNKRITIENAFELLTLIDYHKVDHLKAFVINFIVINLKKIDESHFQSLKSLDLVQEIFLKTRNYLL